MRPRGFTLVELVVVLAVLVIGAAVGVPAFRAWLEEDDLTLATRQVENLFRFARDSAIAGGFPVTVVVDSVSGHVWLDSPSVAEGEGWLDGEPVPVPEEMGEGTSLDIPRTVSIELSRARGRFTFEPDGTAFADTLWLRAPLGARTITLHRWTGDVVVW